jgi:hypothetical protein
MDLAAVYTMSRLNTWTDANNLLDATLLTITNVTYRDLINIITSKVSEDFFYEEWTGTTVIWQTEYTFPVRSSTIAWLKKLEAVSIKYKSTDTEYTVATPSKLTNLDYDKNYYKTNQPTSDPFYIVYDKSVNIFPAPTDTLSFILYWVSDPKELIAWAAEADIKIPLDFHHLIVLGNEYRIYKSRRMTQEKNDALAEYKNEIKEMILQLSDRIIKPLESELPNLNHLS